MASTYPLEIVQTRTLIIRGKWGNGESLAFLPSIVDAVPSRRANGLQKVLQL